MEQNRKFKIILLLVIILTTVCVVEGMVIYKQHKKSTAVTSEDNFDTFSSNMLDKFKRERKDRDDMLDRFFDDDFFANQADPFAEMERMQKKLDKMMGREHSGQFRDSWGSWFGNRFFGSSDDVEFVQREKGASYIITLRIPNLKENKLDIKIDEDGISINGEFSQTAEKKDSDGKVLSKREVHRSISKTYPIPHDADYEKAEVKNKNDKIIITLPKRDS